MSLRAFSMSWSLVGEDSVDGAVVFDTELEGERLGFLLGRGGKSSLESSIITWGGAFLDFVEVMASIGIKEAADAYDWSRVACRPSVVAVTVLDARLGWGK